MQKDLNNFDQQVKAAEAVKAAETFYSAEAAEAEALKNVDALKAEAAEAAKAEALASVEKAEAAEAAKTAAEAAEIALKTKAATLADASAKKAEAKKAEAKAAEAIKRAKAAEANVAKAVKAVANATEAEKAKAEKAEAEAVKAAAEAEAVETKAVAKADKAKAAAEVAEAANAEAVKAAAEAAKAAEVAKAEAEATEAAHIKALSAAEAAISALVAAKAAIKAAAAEEKAAHKVENVSASDDTLKDFLSAEKAEKAKPLKGKVLQFAVALTQGVKLEDALGTLRVKDLFAVSDAKTGEAAFYYKIECPHDILSSAGKDTEATLYIHAYTGKECKSAASAQMFRIVYKRTEDGLQPKAEAITAKQLKAAASAYNPSALADKVRKALAKVNNQPLKLSKTYFMYGALLEKQGYFFSASFRDAAKAKANA